MSDFPAADEMSVNEIAEMLGLNPATVRAWVHHQLVPARRDRRRWLIRRSAIDQLLTERPSLGKPHSARRADNALLGERPPAPAREGTRQHAAGVLEEGLL